MSIELKPCPFCGGEASIAWKGGVHSTRKIIVKCGGCRYQRTDAAMRYGDEWLLDVAVTAWNARAAESASQAAAPSAPYSIDADPDGIRERVADAITGALSFGAQGTHKPPAGHWLEPFWDIARAEREATVPPTVDEATARRLDDYLGGEFDIRIGKQAAHAALVHALAQDRASQAAATVGMVVELTDEIVERAFDAWCDVADVDDYRVRNSREALRAALTAALRTGGGE